MEILMRLMSIWRKLRNKKNSQQGRRSRWRTYKPWAEALEERTVPSATVNWINPAGGDWDTSTNWSGGQVPGASDDVVIDHGTNNFTVTHSSSAVDSVQSLTDRASFSLSGGTLTVAVL